MYKLYCNRLDKLSGLFYIVRCNSSFAAPKGPMEFTVN